MGFLYGYDLEKKVLLNISTNIEVLKYAHTISYKELEPNTFSSFPKMLPVGFGKQQTIFGQKTWPTCHDLTRNQPASSLYFFWKLHNSWSKTSLRICFWTWTDGQAIPMGCASMYEKGGRWRISLLWRANRTCGKMVVWAPQEKVLRHLTGLHHDSWVIVVKTWKV